MGDFDRWRQTSDEAEKGWEIKYYKGLGTSSPVEAKEYFKALKVVTYTWQGGDTSGSALDLAFNKTRANDRKAWLQAYDKTAGLDYGEKEVPFEDFVNRDLIHFSNYDIVRSIPSVCDGLKVSQRKLIFCCLKKNLTKEIKVAQLAGYVSAESAYHHGEVSLQATIVGIAQDFVGANNLNLLLPNGQFGSRLQGGKDCSAARYIHTELNPLTQAIISREDDNILTYLDDDGKTVEPEYYMPVIPMVLVNGAMGIGTGFSTNVPCYNPLDLVAALRHMLSRDERGEADRTADLPDIHPWYRGFTGTIEQAEDGRYFSRGRYQRTKPCEVAVTELPIGFWTDDFKELVECMKQDVPDIKAFKNNSTDQGVLFSITFSSPSALDSYLRVVEAPVPLGAATAEGGGAKTKLRQTQFEKVFKLVSNRNLSTQNMYLFNHEGRIQKYDGVRAILGEYYVVRLAGYSRRKVFLLQELGRRTTVLKNRSRMLQAVVSEELVIHRKSKAELEEELGAMGYDRHPHDETYDYLVSMPMFTLTTDKKEEIDKQLAEVEARIHATERVTERQMWGADLDALMKQYKKLAQE
jgi:DNA topoisomerase-2